MQLRVVLFSLPTETVLLQILLLPQSSSNFYTLSTVFSDPLSDASLAEQALIGTQTLLARPSICVLPVDFFHDGSKLTDSLLPFTTTVDDDGGRTAWFVGLVPPQARDDGAGEWFGRPEAMRKIEGEVEVATLRRAIVLVRAKTDRHYL